MEPTGTERAELPRWQRLLLPGGMVESGRGRRTARDWLVDLVMYVLAVTIGAMALADTWDDHGTAAKIADIALGVVGLVLLWRRRAHPVGIAAATLLLSAVSAAAAGASVAALFNLAIRGPLRALGWLVLLGFGISLVYPLGIRGRATG